MIDNLIVFEGIDGCGKSSQSKRISSWLESLGSTCWVTKEPSDSPIGDFIRGVQSKKISLGLDPESYSFKRIMMSLYGADRYKHLEEIKSRGEDFVICDRYRDSTYAYQYIPGEIWDYVDNFERPLIEIWLDIPVEESLKRISSRKVPEEIFETREYLSGVREVYKDLYEAYDYIYRVDGTLSKDEVTEAIKKIITREVLVPREKKRRKE